MNENRCPECNLLPVLQCRCLLSHSACINGHGWKKCPKCGCVLAAESPAAEHAIDTFDARNLCEKCRGEVATTGK